MNLGPETSVCRNFSLNNVNIFTFSRHLVQDQSYTHPWVIRSVSELTGFVTTSILSCLDFKDGLRLEDKHGFGGLPPGNRPQSECFTALANGNGA